MAEVFLERSLLLDLETLPSDDPAKLPRILKIGAVLGDEGDGGEVLERKGRFRLDEALTALGRLARRAERVLGHNLLGHDLPVLRTLAPGHPLLRLPVVDTLYLSPLAFPENPYHHLVKDYRLVPQAVNDPVSDARLAAELFRDQWRSLGAVGAELPAFYGYCLDEEGAGLAAVLSTVAGRPAMTLAEARRFFADSFWERVCSRALVRAEEGLADPATRPVLAYAAAWLRVAGGGSVLPPWVRHRYPAIVPLLDELREIPCDDRGCRYCRRVHDSEAQLRRFFGFDAFRPEPRAADGGSLQRAVAARGLAGRPLLAILATGAGKSICYQLPALVRHLRRGALTVVISPLQALMKDQVDNLNRLTGSDAAAALYGLLTPPERGVVLERVRLGDVALLYVAPEQLRNRSFQRTIEQREIACWVFDEAHCLSKWGHDFRPDYLYAARFIAQLAERQRVTPPPVACFTATAKEDVRREVAEHFRELLGQELELFAGTVARDELRFAVEEVRPAEKLPRIAEILGEHLADPAAGSAVVYRATRRGAFEAARHLEEVGIPAAAFHAGLKTVQKREVLDAFLGGELRVVCATNAFGMGIDKDDVHLVIHADVPGSLESYLQEAGRAGRDRHPSECVLLFDGEDVEQQFKLAAASHLDRRDVAQILRALRRARHQHRGRRKRRGAADTVVVTSGELLRQEEIETSFDTDDRLADTKVKTAVAWLERAGFVSRDHNQTRVFQGRLRVSSVAEAEEKLDALAPRLRLSAAERRRWLTILKALMAADPDDGLTADELAELPGVGWPEIDPEAPETPGQRVLRLLHAMAETGFLSSGLRLTAWLVLRGSRSAGAAYEAVCRLDRALLEVLAESEPDAPEGGWLELSLRLLNQRLVDRGLDSNPQVLRKLLASLAADGGGVGGAATVELLYRSRNRYRVRVLRPWGELRQLAERRRAVGKVILDTLLELVRKDATGPDAASADAPLPGKALVEFGLEELTDALGRDLALRSQLRDRLRAAERGLLFLHEQRVVELQNGLAVFRQAMTVRLLPDAKGRRYTGGDFEPLARHYDERTFQIHVMARYARLGLETIRDALRLVADYFHLDKERFVGRYFAGEEEEIGRATSQESYRRIVDQLGNPVQTALVAAPADRNLLVLAGPGSGKTRVVVHRCAYLLRVERVPARRILVLCFNRHAALELRRRLRELVGNDARAVTVQTYHGLAMRLTGTSFATLADRDGTTAEGAANGDRRMPDFDTLIPAAVALLTEGAELPGLGAEELREEILASYSHLLVDEYQDITPDQYRLVSALAGRLEADGDRRLTILAVGDDDQNIYSWNGASVEFIRRFREDYAAEVHHLVENYRSTAHVIACANRLIAGNRDRMKHDRPIEVDSRRRSHPPGGRWAGVEPESGGRVRLLTVPDAGRQAVAIADRMFHMKRLDPEWRWRNVAVLARRHAELEPIRAVLEERGVPVRWTARRDLLPPLHRVREVVRFLAALEARRGEPVTASELEKLRAELAGDGEIGDEAGPWWRLLGELLEEWREESGDGALGAGTAREFLYEALVERGREPAIGDGVRLATVHAAKGLELRHLFLADGGWEIDPETPAEKAEEERRLYYVGVTRAQETLHLLRRRDRRNPHLEALAGDHPFLERREPPVEAPADGVADRRYAPLGLQDLFLSYAGRFPPGQPIHQRLAALRPGDPLRFDPDLDRGHLHLVDERGGRVAALSAAGRERWLDRLGRVETVRVLALAERRAEDSPPEHRRNLRAERWWVPVAEVIHRGNR